MNMIKVPSARRVSGASVLIFLASFAASGQAMAEENTFSGFRLELVSGYDNEGVDFDDDVFDGGKNSQSGWLYGFGAGYDFQMGKMVFGFETGLTESTASKHKTFAGLRPTNPIVGAPTPITADVSFDAGGDFYFGGRAGYVVSPQVLIYALLGYSRHKIAIDGHGLDNNVAFTIDEKLKLDGFRLGIGGEYLITNSIFAKAEYRYTNYNNGDLDIRGANVNLDPLFSGIDIVRHQFAVAVGYRF